MIGLVLVTYAHWPQELITSIERSKRDVVWYIHHHGSDPELAEKIRGLGNRANFRVYMHMENRGLARSWNDGLREAYDDGADLALLLNDDLFFISDGFDRFIDFGRSRRDYAVAYLNGLEGVNSAYANTIRAQDFACCIITPLAIAQVGYFDQNFAPAYFEDNDYYKRCRVLGVDIIATPDVLVVHDRSKTTRDNPEIRQHHEDIFHANRDYFTRKWGSDNCDHDVFKHPFNDASLSPKISWSGRDNPYPGHERKPV